MVCFIKNLGGEAKLKFFSYFHVCLRKTNIAILSVDKSIDEGNYADYMLCPGLFMTIFLINNQSNLI